MEPLTDTSKDASQFNDAIKKHSLWAGSRRSVILACEEMCFVYGTELATLLTKSLDSKDLVVKNAGETLSKFFAVGVEKIHILSPIDPNVLKRYIDGETPRRLVETHEAGFNEGVLSMTKPVKPGAGLFGFGGKWVIAIVVLVVLGLIAATQWDTIRAMFTGFGKK